MAQNNILSNRWFVGGVSGLIAGIIFGLMLQFMMTPVISVAIPALYGLTGNVLGWIIHLIHSIIFGVIFTAIISIPQIKQYTDTQRGSGFVGLIYGVVIWVLAAAIVMPIWLQSVGFGNPPPLPNFNPQSLIGHLVYGVILGIIYPLLKQ